MSAAILGSKILGSAVLASVPSAPVAFNPGWVVNVNAVVQIRRADQ